MTEHNTILYISDRANSGDSALTGLEKTGMEVAITNCSTEGVALLYIMPAVAAVVLDNRTRKRASFDVAQSLLKIRPNVPIILLCSEQIDGSPSRTDRCVSANKLTSALQRLLKPKPVF